MTRMTAHSPSLWTRRLSISKVRPTFSVYSWFLLFSLLASAAFLDTLVCIHRLSLSFVHSPPLRDLDWSTQIPGNACMDTMSRMLHTGASLLWILFKLWSELLLISGDEHESGKNLTATQRASQAIFFVSSLAFLAMAEEEDCFLCASADELRELNSAAAGRPLWMSLNDRIDSKLQPCLLHSSCLFFCVYLTRIWPVRCAADTFLFSPFDRFLTHLLQPLFVFVFHHLFLFFFSSLPTPNTPQSCLAPLRPVFSLWDHPPQSMDHLPSHLPHAPSHVCVSKLHAVALQAEG